ncbi:Endoglucanase V-like protein [Mycena kentingensis (nom. inval.)]|nr:Endoglucanase V-like protein [Mycena kentingensis (nom. inval.)]
MRFLTTAPFLIGESLSLPLVRSRHRGYGVDIKRPVSQTRLVVVMFLQAIFVALLAKRAFAAAGGYIQTAGPGNASFTMYSGCQQPACGVAATGFTAAMHQLAFGSVPGIGPGDACGRCFSITGNRDPFSPAYTGPFGQTIVVKVTDMCPVAGNEQWCGQTVQNQANQFGMPAHFDLCVDNGAAAVFFPSGHGALTGTWQEVSCSLWSGTDKSPSFNGACILGENAGLWPAVGCGNQGLAPGAHTRIDKLEAAHGYDLPLWS